PEDPGTRWSITVAGGPSMMAMRREVLRGGERYEIEVQRAASLDGRVLGVAIEAGPDDRHYNARHEIGVAGFVGSSWRSRRTFLEMTVGLGLEFFRGMTRTFTLTDSSSAGI